MKERKWSGMLLVPAMAGVTMLAGATTAMAQSQTSAKAQAPAFAYAGSIGNTGPIADSMSGSSSKTNSSNTMSGSNSKATNSSNSMSGSSSKTNSGNSMTGSNSTASSTNSMSGSSTKAMKSMVKANDILVGPAASPPMGMGNGQLNLVNARTSKNMAVPLAKGANAFKSAVDGNIAYVPTLQGITYVVNLRSHKVVTTFSTPKGARIANIADIAMRRRELVITGSKSVTAYALPSRKLMWTANVGGNTLAVAGKDAYVSGNASKTTQIINLATGKVTGSLPVGMIEDSAYDARRHTLWLANWNNGDMTIVNTRDNKVEKVIQEKEGGGFSMADMGNMKAMMMAKGGFMQLAVGPRGKFVYAASFSGNIMVYDAATNMFKGDIPTLPMAKLSGIAIDASGRYAYTTVENKMETIAVSLRTHKVVATYPNLESNRWSVMHGKGMS